MADAVKRLLPFLAVLVPLACLAETPAEEARAAWRETIGILRAAMERQMEVSGESPVLWEALSKAADRQREAEEWSATAENAAKFALQAAARDCGRVKWRAREALLALQDRPEAVAALDELFPNWRE